MNKKNILAGPCEEWLAAMVSDNEQFDPLLYHLSIVSVRSRELLSALLLPISLLSIEQSLFVRPSSSINERLDTEDAVPMIPIPRR